MRRILVGLALLAAAGCDLPTGGGTRLVEVESPFTLREGQRAFAHGTDLSVEFVDVPLDERCPIEALCASAGNAVVRVRLSYRTGEPQTFELQTMDANPRVSLGSYAVVMLDLQPPRSLQEPDPDYRVRLRMDPVFTRD